MNNFARAGGARGVFHDIGADDYCASIEMNDRKTAFRMPLVLLVS